MTPATDDPLTPILVLFPGRERQLRELLAPCLGYVFRLQPPQPELDAIVQRAFGWLPLRSGRPFTTEVLTKPIAHFAGHYGPIPLGMLYKLFPDHYPFAARFAESQKWWCEDAAKFSGAITAGLRDDRWQEPSWRFWADDGSWERNWELLAKLRAERRGHRLLLGDQLEDSLDESLPPSFDGEVRENLFEAFRASLRLAVGYTGIGEEAEAAQLKALLHELWLRGNYPWFLSSDADAVFVLCAPA